MAHRGSAQHVVNRARKMHKMRPCYLTEVAAERMNAAILGIVDTQWKCCRVLPLHTVHHIPHPRSLPTPVLRPYSQLSTMTSAADVRSIDYVSLAVNFSAAVTSCDVTRAAVMRALVWRENVHRRNNNRLAGSASVRVARGPAAVSA